MPDFVTAELQAATSDGEADFWRDAASDVGNLTIFFNSPNAATSPSMTAGVWLALTCTRNTPAWYGTAGKTTDCT